MLFCRLYYNIHDLTQPIDSSYDVVSHNLFDNLVTSSFTAHSAPASILVLHQGNTFAVNSSLTIRGD